jgi:hypothetical protein
LHHPFHFGAKAAAAIGAASAYRLVDCADAFAPKRAGRYFGRGAKPLPAEGAWERRMMEVDG